MVKILHINSSEYAGGVAEMLVSLVHKFGENYLCKRLVINRPIEFYQVTKKIHNNLHGTPVEFTEKEVEIYNTDYSDDIKILSMDYDIIVIHDPQPLPLITYIKKINLKAKVIWRCHIPVDKNSFAWKNLLKNYVEQCDIAIFSMKDYVPKPLRIPVKIFTPCIDLYSIKNVKLDNSFRVKLLKDLGIEPNDKYIVQISRFDLLKGVEELVETYNKLTIELPDYKFILASNLAGDDPEGVEVYKKLVTLKKGSNIKLLILSDEPNLNKLQVNALQANAELVIQNSIEEGFGLVVTEAMYKEKVVVTRKVGGITLQVKHTENGFIYSPKEDLYTELKTLLTFGVKEEIGKKAKQTVVDNFSMGVLVNNYKELIGNLIKEEVK